jgi:hypothetical protein
MSTHRVRVLVLAFSGAALYLLTFVLLHLPLGLGNGSNSPAGVSGWGFLIGLLGLFGGGGLIVAGWVIALVETAQIKRWGWFGGMLGEGIALVVLSSVISFYAPWAFLILPLTLMLYGFIGPSTPTSKVA